VGQIGDGLLLLSLATMISCHNGDMQQMSFTRKAKIIDCKQINEGHCFSCYSLNYYCRGEPKMVYCFWKWKFEYSRNRRNILL